MGVTLLQPARLQIVKLGCWHSVRYAVLEQICSLNSVLSSRRGTYPVPKRNLVENKVSLGSVSSI